MRSRITKNYGLLYVSFQYFYHRSNRTFRGPSYCRTVVKRHIGDEYMHCHEMSIVLVCWRLFADNIYTTATPPCGILVGYPSTINKVPFPFFVYRQFSSIAVMPSSTTCSTTDTNVSEISKFRVPADQPVPISPIHIATSRCTNFLSSSLRSFWNDFSIHSCIVAAMEPQDTTWRQMVAMRPSFLICTRPSRVTLASTTFETSWSTRMLQGSNLPMNDCTVWTLRECALLVIVVFELELMSINRASFKFFLLFPMITLVLQTVGKIALLLFMHPG